MPPQFMSTSQTPSFKFSWVSFQSSDKFGPVKMAMATRFNVGRNVWFMLSLSSAQTYVHTSYHTLTSTYRQDSRQIGLSSYIVSKSLPDWVELLCQNWVTTLMQSSTWSHYWNSAWEEWKTETWSKFALECILGWDWIDLFNLTRLILKNMNFVSLQQSFIATSLCLREISTTRTRKGRYR